MKAIRRHPLVANLLGAIGQMLLTQRRPVGPLVSPEAVGHFGVADSRAAAHRRGNGSARVKRAAIKARNVRANRRAHRG
jgi:hypothetical protein